MRTLTIGTFFDQTGIEKGTQLAMEDWQTDFLRFVETVTTTVEDFLGEVEQTLEQVGESVLEDVTTPLESLWREWIEPFVDSDHDIAVEFVVPPPPTEEEPNLWLNPKIAATTNVHPACIGCCHYHGRVYNNTIFVCGMHPYGSESNRCPDWQSMIKTS